MIIEYLYEQVRYFTGKLSVGWIGRYKNDELYFGLTKTKTTRLIHSLDVEYQNLLASATDGIMLEDTDLDTVFYGGRYGVIGSGNTNIPRSGEFFLNVMFDGARTMQLAVYPDMDIYSRVYSGGSWGAWQRPNADSIEYDSTSTIADHIASISNKNYLINGDFNVWQRGATFSLTQGYTADNAYFKSSHAGSVDRVEISPNKYALQASPSASATYFILFFPIENGLDVFEEKTVTVSVRMKASTSATVNIQALKCSVITSRTFVDIFTRASVTTDYQTFTGDITLPAYDASNPNLLVSLYSTELAGETLTIDWVKFEDGTVATPNSPRLQAEDLMLCQSSVKLLKPNATYRPILSGFATSTTEATFVVQHDLMETPNKLVYSSGSGVLQLYDGTSNYAVTALSVTSYGDGVTTLKATVASGLTQFRPYVLMTWADATAYILIAREL